MPDFGKYSEKYNLPDDRDQFVDVSKGEIVDKKDIVPLEVIKMLSKKLGIVISDPSKGCKHCYERGYTAKEVYTGVPVPCSCLFRKMSADEKAKNMMAFAVHGNWNRDKRREMTRNMRKQGIISAVKKGAEHAGRDQVDGVAGEVSPSVD